MKGKRELLRKNKYLIDRITNQVEVMTRMAISLFNYEPENKVFTDGTFNDDSMDLIKIGATKAKKGGK